MEKEQIFKISQKHFFAKKYTDVKLDNIANDLRIRKPTLYYYFQDKKDLFLQTLRYSITVYTNDLKEILSSNDLEVFINWYIMYPSKTKNLFAISFQKGVCTDKIISSIIFNWKNAVNNLLFEFLWKFTSNPVKIYLFLNLLEKLAQDNCIDWYCLKFDLEKIIWELKNIIKN